MKEKDSGGDMKIGTAKNISGTGRGVEVTGRGVEVTERGGEVTERGVESTGRGVEVTERGGDKEQKKQVPLRLSRPLWDELTAWAEDEFRSVNGQIEYLLSECVKRRKRA